jgi:predicted short-subunit dehydrogenase-like oxidoreductase (DUF2520 family)
MTMKTIQRAPKVSFIGAGVVGSTLARALHLNGYRIVSIVDRNGSSALTLAKLVKCTKVGVVASDISPQTEVLFLTVNDDEIENLTFELAKQKKPIIKNILVIHCSGAHTVAVLDPLRKKGNRTGAMHPIQTFPHLSNPAKHLAHIKGIYYGIEAAANSIKQVEKIVQDVGGKSIVIPEELKPLYHTTCVFASNYLTMFLNTVSELSQIMQLPRQWTEVFGPLMSTTMENVIKTSPSSALTGPIVRGDIKTVGLHLESLSKYAPYLLPLYTTSGIEAARIARNHGKISDENFTEIIRTFRKFIRTHTFPKLIRDKK